MTLPRPARRVIAEDVLAQRVNVDVYPFRYLYLSVPASIRPERENGRAEFDARVDVVLTAVELLEARGWELVNLAELGQIAFMRRVGPPRGKPDYPRSDAGHASREFGQRGWETNRGGGQGGWELGYGGGDAGRGEQVNRGSGDPARGGREIGETSREMGRGSRDAWS